MDIFKLDTRMAMKSHFLKTYNLYEKIHILLYCVWLFIFLYFCVGELYAINICNIAYIVSCILTFIGIVPVFIRKMFKKTLSLWRRILIHIILITSFFPSLIFILELLHQSGWL